MRIRVLSDLHIDFGGHHFPDDCGEDLVVLAGDICEGLAGIDWALRAFPQVPIVYVPGNHEFYGADRDAFRATMRETIAGLQAPRFHLLDDAAITLDGWRLIGSTLWTDFRLYGESPADVKRAMDVCQRSLLDFRHIHVADANGANTSGANTSVAGEGVRRIVPEDTVMWHRRARQYLSLALASGDPAKTIVITHHGPHGKSLAPRYADDLTSAGFISNLGPLISRTRLWIHGHTHTSFDYAVGDARVVCNPRGYCRADGSDCENPDFRWDLIVEV